MKGKKNNEWKLEWENGFSRGRKKSYKVYQLWFNTTLKNMTHDIQERSREKNSKLYYVDENGINTNKKVYKIDYKNLFITLTN